MANIGGAAVVNVVAFSAGSVVYTAAISAVLSRGPHRHGHHGARSLPGHHADAFILMAPLLSFTRILGHSGDGQRLLKRGGRDAWNYALRRFAARDGTNDALNHQREDEEADCRARARGQWRASAIPPRCAAGRSLRAPRLRPDGQRDAARPASSPARSARLGGGSQGRPSGDRRPRPCSRVGSGPDTRTARRPGVRPCWRIHGNPAGAGYRHTRSGATPDHGG